MRTLWIAGLCILVISVGWAQDKCTDNSDCPEGWYCAKIDGGCEGPGMCQKRPDACLAVWDPVCGCDGQTYSNACYAAMAGVNVAHPGPCVKTACKDNDGCEEGWYCHKAKGDCEDQGEWPVRFAPEDVNVVDESGAPVEYVAEGTDTAIMTLRFTAVLSRNRYVITIADTVTGLDSELPIDGDDDGRAGGDAVIVLEHRRRADFTGDNRIDLEDLARFAEA